MRPGATCLVYVVQFKGRAQADSQIITALFYFGHIIFKNSIRMDQQLSVDLSVDPTVMAH